jgi:murein DD-endopeptidase MepM/ murein hydrolase activator NlpD
VAALLPTIAASLAAATAGAPAPLTPQTQWHRADVQGRQFVFPVAGRARIGTEPAQRLGGLRNHGGQDVFARCGTPVVAARGGTVRLVKYEGAAGNYIVIDAPDKRSYVYMHLRRLPRFSEGDGIAAGARVGEVGRTGDAWGCHLHFEVWTAPGWYSGGRPVDPYGVLRRAARLS